MSSSHIFWSCSKYVWVSVKFSSNLLLLYGVWVWQTKINDVLPILPNVVIYRTKLLDLPVTRIFKMGKLVKLYLDYVCRIILYFASLISIFHIYVNEQWICKTIGSLNNTVCLRSLQINIVKFIKFIKLKKCKKCCLRFFEDLEE